MIEVECPICQRLHRTLERYASSVCMSCSTRQVDRAGRRVSAYNVAGCARGIDVPGFDGAVLVQYVERDADGREVVAADATRTHRVWVDSLECVVVEGRFGGTFTIPLQAAVGEGFRVP